MSQKIWLITGNIETGRASPTLDTTFLGTSSGFGRRFVLSALLRGDKVIAASRTLDTIQDIPEQIKTVSTINLDANLRLLQLDVNWDTQKIHAKVNEAVDIWGRVDVLVNNAGVGLKGIIEEVR